MFSYVVCLISSLPHRTKGIAIGNTSPLLLNDITIIIILSQSSSCRHYCKILILLSLFFISTKTSYSKVLSSSQTRRDPLLEEKYTTTLALRTFFCRGMMSLSFCIIVTMSLYYKDYLWCSNKNELHLHIFSIHVWSKCIFTLTSE